MNSKKIFEDWKPISLVSIFTLALISLILSSLTNLTYNESFRIVFGSVYILFLPGFIISYLFFPKTKTFDSKSENPNSIDTIERIALSFALSIAIVPLVVFYFNLIGIKISALSTFLIVLGIIIVSLLIIRYKNKKFTTQN